MALPELISTVSSFEHDERARTAAATKNNFCFILINNELIKKIEIIIGVQILFRIYNVPLLRLHIYSDIDILPLVHPRVETSLAVDRLWNRQFFYHKMHPIRIGEEWNCSVTS